MSKTLKAAVIGDPIGHSLSPKLHGFWLKKYGIEGSYEAIQVKPENLATALKSMIGEGYAGFNATIPHKEKIFDLLNDKTKFPNVQIAASARFCRAVNTIVCNQAASSIKEAGHFSPNNLILANNSDGEGFIKNLEKHSPNLILKDKNIFLIGAGGAARGIALSLAYKEVKNIFITNRTKQKVDQIIEDFQNPNLGTITQKTTIKFLEKKEFEKNLSLCDILINTSSLGMLNQEKLDINLQHLNQSSIVCDIVYKPLMTELLQESQKRGNKIVTGIGMLAFQGTVGFEAWFKHKPEVSDDLLEFLIKESQK